MKYNNFKELEKAYTKPFSEGNYEECLDMLEKGVAELRTEDYKDNEFVILLDKAVIQLKAGYADKCMDTASHAIDLGYLFPLHFRSLEPIRGTERYQELKKRNDVLLEKAQKEAEMQYQVVLPEGYSEAEKYPLMLILHGDGGDGNIRDMSANWKPDVFSKKNYIVVYIQSSQVLCHNGYGWLPNPETARTDIKNCFKAVKAKYSVNESNVYISGFSGGAIASIDIALSNAIPVKGFISLCPSMIPDAYTPENIKAAVQRGVKGFMMEGEEAKEDIQIEEEILKGFNAEGLQCEFVINKNVGHWYPSDLDEKLVMALEYVSQ